MGKEQIREYPVSIEWQGETYDGTRVVNGTRRLFQEIYFRGRSKFDSHRYAPSDTKTMEVMAMVILRELVEEVERAKEED